MPVTRQIIKKLVHVPQQFIEKSYESFRDNQTGHSQQSQRGMHGVKNRQTVMVYTEDKLICLI